jgi:hypothetical protein
MTVAISVNLTILVTPFRLAETVAEPSALTVHSRESGRKWPGGQCVTSLTLRLPRSGRSSVRSAGLGDRHLHATSRGRRRNADRAAYHSA